MTESLPLTFLDAGEDTGRPPLLVLHGLFGSARNWQQLARRFAAGRKVWALDLRNHGGSPWSDAMGYPDMAADLARFLDDRGIGRAAVLGHSMGGKAAMALALTRPERVERLVVADIAPVAYTHTHAPYVAAMKAVDLGVSRRAEVEAQLAGAVPDPSLRAFLTQNLALEEGRFRWRINLDAIGAAMPGLVGFPDFGGARYDGPALFVGGARSDYLAAEHLPAVTRHFPRARVEMVPDAGHWVHAERPDAFAAAVEGFL
ncbi:MAG TPA: alpha/beta fold hydrolase [Azospirillaceae bacterium]|nr:alpha/beta fold hydrolase [Azospirillaceae bacterium]